MALLSEKAKLVFERNKRKQREQEYNARIQVQERKAKRAAIARQVDDPTPGSPLQTPSQKLIDRRNKIQLERELVEINSMHEL